MRVDDCDKYKDLIILFILFYTSTFYTQGTFYLVFFNSYNLMFYNSKTIGT